MNNDELQMLYQMAVAKIGMLVLENDALRNQLERQGNSVDKIRVPIDDDEGFGDDDDDGDDEDGEG